MTTLSRGVRLLLCSVLLIALSPGIAYAYWVATDSSHSALARAEVLPSGLRPRLAVDDTTVTIAISRVRSSDRSGAVLLTSYRVSRFPVGSTVAAAGFDCVPVAPLLHCAERSVPDGAWEYAVAPVLGNWVGGSSPHSAPVVVDGNGPVLSIDIPAATRDRTPRIGGTAGTAVGDLPAVTVRIFNGNTLVQTRTVDAVAGRWTLDADPLAPNESYAVQASQRDSAGNVTVVSSGFVLDTVAPSISLNTVPATVGATPTLSGGAGTVTASLHSSADSATVNVLIYAGPSAAGVPVQTLAASRVGKSWSIVTAALAPGEYTAKANLSDAAGNISFSSPKSFTVAEEVSS